MQHCVLAVPQVPLVDSCATGVFAHCSAVTKVSGPIKNPVFIYFSMCVCVYICTQVFLAQGIECAILAASIIIFMYIFAVT